MSRIRVALLGVLLFASPAVLGQDAPPTAGDFRSNADTERYADAAVRFINAHRDDPRSDMTALQLLAVGQWGRSAPVVRYARQHLLFNSPKSPQAFLAARDLGGAGPYRDFVLGVTKELMEVQPPAKVAHGFLVSLYPGLRVYDDLLQDPETAVTASVLGEWLLANGGKDANPAVVEFVRPLLEKVKPTLDRLGAGGEGGDAAAWAAAGRVLRDDALAPAGRVEQIAAAVRDGRMPSAALDLAILMLPEDAAMSPAVTRVRAARAVDAGRWKEVAALSKALLDRPDDAGGDAGGDLAQVRRWRAFALAVVASGRQTAETYRLPDEAAELLRSDADDAASARLLAGLDHPAVTNHTEVYRRTRNAMAAATWAEAAGEGGGYRFYAYDAPDAKEKDAVRTCLAIADAAGLLGFYRVDAEGAVLWTRGGRCVASPAGEAGFVYDVSLLPVTAAGASGEFGVKTGNGRETGVLALLQRWARDERFAPRDRGTPRITEQLAAAGMWPTIEDKTLSWTALSGLRPARPVVKLRLDDDALVVGAAEVAVGEAVASVAELRYGSGKAPAPTPPAWAQLPADAATARRDTPLDAGDLMGLLVEASKVPPAPATRPADDGPPR